MTQIQQIQIAKDQKYDAEYVRDVWVAEWHGGPNTECEGCPNYNMNDLTDYYFPALIGG
ncbi:hypothetical protein M0R19_00230 [Candidatus Pacearchaeota archaeon]|nr:hypothetical protein [Candidatus Pacearchaeota archaeon]